LPRVNCPRFLVKLLFNQRFDPIDDRFRHNSGALVCVMDPIGVKRRQFIRKQTRNIVEDKVLLGRSQPLNGRPYKRLRVFRDLRGERCYFAAVSAFTFV